MAETNDDPARNQGLQLLLVEDNPVFIDQITAAIGKLQRAVNVTIAREGLGAIPLIRKARRPFDIILVDIGLPDISGIEVIRACNTMCAETPVIVVSVFATEAAVLRAIEEGARGYIVKSDHVEEIAGVIEQVMQGIYPLSSSLARFLFRKLSNEQPGSDAGLAAEIRLTPRELETLQYLSYGLSYTQAAEHLGVTLSTVQTNVKSLYRKLNVRSKVQAIAKARSHDLI